MRSKEIVIFFFTGLFLFSFLLLIIFGDKGYIDLCDFENRRDNLIYKNSALEVENSDLYRSIDRSRNDPVYIENIARQELGMIGKDEIIFKLKK